MSDNGLIPSQCPQRAERGPEDSPKVPITEVLTHPQELWELGSLLKQLLSVV